MLRIFDCSNGPARPHHRKISLCPRQNTIVRDLKEYAKYFNCMFTYSPDSADIIFINDVFPDYLLDYPQPKVKRMDGVFQLEGLKDRNEKLNQAAEQADHVIFISLFSSGRSFSHRCLYKFSSPTHK